jgi:small subunit ribosomal protein S27Ae
MAKKPKPKNKRPSKVWKKYQVKEGKIQRAKTCIKCGSGYFLADHKDRYVCGKCGYSEKKSK